MALFSLGSATLKFLAGAQAAVTVRPSTRRMKRTVAATLLMPVAAKRVTHAQYGAPMAIEAIEFLTSLPRVESGGSVYVILRKRSVSPWVPPYPVFRPEVWRGMAGNDFVATQTEGLF